MFDKILIILLTIVLCIASLFCNAQTVCSSKDGIIFQKYISEFSAKRNLPINELIVSTGKFFLDKPYVAATLEQEGEEQLVVNLREFDCTTFVESILALSLTLQSENQTFDNYQKNLTKIRYRNGVIDGYASRLHYPSDWLYDNSDLFEDITLKLGGKTINKPLNFMSSHAHLYPHLKTNSENQNKILEIEQSINQRQNYSLLTVAQIKYGIKDLRTGDIVIFGTKTKGLDYSHIGIVFWENNTLKLLHASSARKRVIVDTKNLVQYCTTSKSCIGITVFRVKDNICDENRE